MPIIEGALLLLQRTLRIFFFQSDLNLGPTHRTLKKKSIFVSKCVDMVDIHGTLNSQK